MEFVTSMKSMCCVYGKSSTEMQSKMRKYILEPIY
jgi:hypothetical protein